MKLFAFRSLVVTTAISMSQVAVGQSTGIGIDEDQALSSYLKVLSSLNTYSPLEPAGSRGAMGLSAGIGASQIDAEKPSPMTNAGLSANTISEGQTLSSPRIYVLKGLFYPLDIGMNFALVEGTSARQWGAHLQYTLYEEFRRPAVSLRIGHSELTGLRGTEFQSNRFETLASMGLLRYFSLYGGIGLSQHEAAITTAELLTPEELSLMQQSIGQNAESIKTESVQVDYFCGLTIMALPPFFTATIESHWADGVGSDAEKSIAAKISVGM